jgi:ComF family protein
MNVGTVGRRLFGWVRGLDAAAMPQTCPACHAWADGLLDGVCRACARQLGAIGAVPYCGRCGRTAHPLAITNVCPGCRTERHWNIRGLARAGSYPPLLRQMVLQLKYGGEERLAPALAARMAAAVRAANWPDAIDALVPVPMHWLRRAQRRCNHARLLARALGRELDLPVLRACKRVRHTRSQVGLTAPQRFGNIERCFDPAPRADLADKTVCIVDNLMATGATVCEVSKALRRAGAKRIYAAVAARAVSSGEPQADDAAVVESWSEILQLRDASSRASLAATL